MLGKKLGRIIRSGSSACPEWDETLLRREDRLVEWLRLHFGPLPPLHTFNATRGRDQHTTGSLPRKVKGKVARSLPTLTTRRVTSPEIRGLQPALDSELSSERTVTGLFRVSLLCVMYFNQKCGDNTG